MTRWNRRNYWLYVLLNLKTFTTSVTAFNFLLPNVSYYRWWCPWTWLNEAICSVSLEKRFFTAQNINVALGISFQQPRDKNAINKKNHHLKHCSYHTILAYTFTYLIWEKRATLWVGTHNEHGNLTRKWCRLGDAWLGRYLCLFCDWSTAVTALKTLETGNLLCKTNMKQLVRMPEITPNTEIKVLSYCLTANNVISRPI